MVFRILTRCFPRAQEIFKEVAKRLVNRVEAGPIKERSTNPDFFPQYLEFHMIILEFQISPIFWNFLEQTGLLISSVYYR